MGVKAISYSMLVLRVLTLLLLIASAVCMFRNTYKLDGEKTTWKDLRTYRYVFATAIIGAFYTLIQLPFAIYYAYTEKRLIRHWLLPEFDFYADKLISYILATGVGAGFAASVELKAFLDEVVVLIDFIFLAENKKVDLGYSIDEFHNRIHTYLDRGIIATVLLTLGFACMAMSSILSSLSRPKSGSQSRFFFG